METSCHDDYEHKLFSPQMKTPHSGPNDHDSSVSHKCHVEFQRFNSQGKYLHAMQAKFLPKLSLVCRCNLNVQNSVRKT